MASANCTDLIASLVREIITVVAQPDIDFFTNESGRLRVLQASRKLTAALEKPEDVAAEVASWPIHTVCLKIATDLGLFNLLAEAEGPKSAEELAAASGGQCLLIVRIMHVLSAMGFIAELAKQVYVATPVTREMAQPSFEANLGHLWDQSVSSLRESPQYLSKNGHQSPFEIRNKTLQDAIHTDTQASNLGMKSLPITKSFNTPSSGNQSAKTSWVDWLPIQEQLLDGVTGRQEEVLVVNMTGDGGYDLQAFKRKFPNVRGRLILQDQLDVISKIQNLDSSIECMEHDFLSPQPIIGARTYILPYFVCPFAPSISLELLRITASSMKPGYSKLILHDLLLQSRDYPLVAAGSDTNIIAVDAWGLRTGRRWRSMMDQAGLVVLGIWKGEGDKGIIMAEVSG